MAGHSKWANIKHKKAATDAKRGKIFTRLIKEITVAARMGGGDPNMNPRLRLAVDKAYENNMPKDNVERAIKRGVGGLDGANYEQIRYEGYGLNGVAVIVDTLTDNRIRTVAEVRHAFTKHGGNMGNEGSVAFLFKHVGQLLFAPGTDENRLMEAGELAFFDKVEPKFSRSSEPALRASGVRIVPPAVARRGSYLAKNVVMMPSYVNIGAYVDEGTMVDTWVTVGSCAQIGRNVHLSGGVGIGGVLEPMQANPTIIEDNCFIGARSEIVEGVIVEENSVISMGVYIGQSTKIYDRATAETTYGRIPAGSVVVSGNLPSADGKYSLYCAVIVKRVDAQTRAKTSINDLLRS